MERMGPTSPVKSEPERSQDRPPQQRQRKSVPATGGKLTGKLEEDRAEVASTEPEKHKLDERA